MKSNILIAVVVAGLTLTSCSKTEEIAEPTQNQSPKSITWVSYSLDVADADESIPYDITYLEKGGYKTIKSHTGDFFARVPVMTYDSARTKYARTLLTYKVFGTIDGEGIALHTAMKITTDYGLVIAEISQNDGNCGGPERTVDETIPFNWFSMKAE